MNLTNSTPLSNQVQVFREGDLVAEITQQVTEVVEVNTLGPRGIQGIQGIQGIGSVGSDGAQGIQGRQGIQGIQGRQGTQAAQGRQGTQGTQGVQGVANTGAQGTAGSSIGPAPYLIYSAAITQVAGQLPSASILIDDYAGGIYPYSTTPGQVIFLGTEVLDFSKIDVQFSYVAVDGTEIIAAWREVEYPFISIRTNYGAIGANYDGALDLMTVNFFGPMIFTIKEYL